MAGESVAMELLLERSRQIDLGYTPEHDQEMGAVHVVYEAHQRLGHMGEVSSPEAFRAELIEAGALIVAAIEVLDSGAA